MATRTALTALMLVGALLVACTGQTPADEAISTYAARDDPRYSRDADYRRAWDNGFAICFNEKFLQEHGR